MAKKADVYAQEFMDIFKEREKEPEEALTETIIIICQRLIREIEEIMISRRATSDTAFEAVVKEQDQKWKAVVRRLDPSKLPSMPSPGAFRHVWDTFKVQMLKTVSPITGELLCLMVWMILIVKRCEKDLRFLVFVITLQLGKGEK